MATDSIIREAWGDSMTRRPTRDLLMQIPLLTVTPTLEIDYQGADPDLLVQLAENAEVVTRTVQLGLSAIGQLLARAAPEIETHEISAEVIEALGWIMAELGDFAATATCLSVACRRHTADYAPQIRRPVRSAKP